MVAPSDLTRIQLDILSVLAEGSRIGADVRRELDADYETAVSRRVVYTHLSTLTEKGLVRQQPAAGSDRATEYSLTDTGRHLIREYVSTLLIRVQIGEHSYR